MTSKQTPRFGFSLEYVADIEAARRFYVEVMGLTVQRTNPQFVQFENFAIASDAPQGKDGEREVYWIIDDADTSHAELSKTARVTVPLKQMPFGKVFAIEGAAGKPCYFVEFAAARPSQGVNRAAPNQQGKNP
jgi:catechol 2,3-dioxygenase-like lactoylglutathione lyase family enzyme